MQDTPFPTHVTFWFLADSRTDLNNDVGGSFDRNLIWYARGPGFQPEI